MADMAALARLRRAYARIGCLEDAATVADMAALAPLPRRPPVGPRAQPCRHPCAIQRHISPRLAIRALLLGVCLMLSSACAGGPEVVRLGAPAPRFALPNVDGGTVRLGELKGRPVVVNSWATWCAPCREEMPLLEEAYEHYRARGLAVIAVNMEEDERIVRRWIDQGGFTFTFVRDTDGTQVKRWNVNSAPTTWFVDADGVARDVKFGALSRGELEARIDRLLNVGAAAAPDRASRRAAVLGQ